MLEVSQGLDEERVLQRQVGSGQFRLCKGADGAIVTTELKLFTVKGEAVRRVEGLRTTTG